MEPVSNENVTLFAPRISPSSDRRILTVTELITKVKQSVETNFASLAVVGELSSFRAWRSGHWYFDIKDNQALISAVMFRHHCARVRFEPQDGLKVIITGRVSLYAPQSKIQIVVEAMEPVGQGALALAFEQLKKRLESEGLFAPHSKKSIPQHPRTVGIVTSPQGAVLQDMLRILRSRMPGIHIILSASRVQGPGAASEIRCAIERLDQSALCDVIIVGRGGGSLEDLWAFNEEEVARAIFECKTPIVSAVGHETDFSIADFVADLRCATPTHAAQTVVPNHVDLVTTIKTRDVQLAKGILAILTNRRLQLSELSNKLADPHRALHVFFQRIDDLSRRLEARMRVQARRALEKMARLESRLEHVSPSAMLNIRKQRLAHLTQKLWQYPMRSELEKRKRILDRLARRLETIMVTTRTRARERLGMRVAQLEALSPFQVLSRGFAFVRHDASRAVVTSIVQITPGDSIRVQFCDGETTALVTQTQTNRLTIGETNGRDSR